MSILNPVYYSQSGGDEPIYITSGEFTYTVNLTETYFTDPFLSNENMDEGIFYYDWGDGQGEVVYGNQIYPQHEYETPGNYKITVSGIARPYGDINNWIKIDLSDPPSIDNIIRIFGDLTIFVDGNDAPEERNITDQHIDFSIFPNLKSCIISIENSFENAAFNREYSPTQAVYLNTDNSNLETFYFQTCNGLGFRALDITANYPALKSFTFLHYGPIPEDIYDDVETTLSLTGAPYIKKASIVFDNPPNGNFYWQILLNNCALLTEFELTSFSNWYISHLSAAGCLELNIDLTQYSFRREPSQRNTFLAQVDLTNCHSQETLPTNFYQDTYATRPRILANFANCYKINGTLNLGFVENIAFSSNPIADQYSFQNCYKLSHPPTLPLTAYISSSSKRPSIPPNSFQNCYSLPEPPIFVKGSIHTYNTPLAGMASAFENCINMVHPPVLPAGIINQTTTGSGSLYSSAFKNCIKMIDIPECFKEIIKTTAFTSANFQSCFEGCESLTTITLRIRTVGSSSGPFNNMFKNCVNLTRINSSDYLLYLTTKTSSLQTSVSMFEGCISLSNLPPSTSVAWCNTDGGTAMFRNCGSISTPITYAAMPANVK